MVGPKIMRDLFQKCSVLMDHGGHDHGGHDHGGHDHGGHDHHDHHDHHHGGWGHDHGNGGGGGDGWGYRPFTGFGGGRYYGGGGLLSRLFGWRRRRYYNGYGGGYNGYPNYGGGFCRLTQFVDYVGQMPRFYCDCPPYPPNYQWYQCSPTSPAPLRVIQANVRDRQADRQT
ncbi:hypothetical protein L3Y34_015622 [Caenorhabditis briggsae]|uniref:Uncharacterized protein n=1 Tax=Caenorhabditis briggsae TaxID=6238 RepID=A0AAE9IZI6_CAEBR|nr:hypothetical protein L3Y34_015622 [Caenorhabditis briggsae]